MNRSSGQLAISDLKPLGLFLLRKGGMMAAGWVVVYFLTIWLNMNQGILMLFAPLLGAMVGLVYGWMLAENAADTAGFSGLVLWIILIATAWLAIWIPEYLLGTLTGHGIGGFGRWMLIMCAMIMSMAAAIWRGSADG
ncbi:MAG: hypothetical protein WCI73_07880 [Phycisphaerae bacterium]